MLYPSIDELVRKVDSKYTLVTIAAKRARQLRDGVKVLVDEPKSKKFVGIALEEIVLDQVRYESLNK